MPWLGFDNIALQPHSASGGFQLLFRQLCLSRVPRIDERSNSRGTWQQFAQESEPLGCKLGRKHIDACRIPAGPAEADDETERHRILGDGEYDRYGCRRRLSSDCNCRRSWCSNDRYLMVDKISSKLSKSIIMATCPAVLNRQILSLNKTLFIEPSPE